MSSIVTVQGIISSIGDDSICIMPESKNELTIIMPDKDAYLRIGDKISIVCDYKNKTLTALNDPFVFIPVDKFAIKALMLEFGILFPEELTTANARSIRSLLSETNAKLYSALSKNYKIELKSVTKAFNYSLFLIDPKLKKVTDKAMEALMNKWEVHFDNRQLILFSLTLEETTNIRKEIANHKFLRSKRAIIDAIIDDPLRVYEITWSQCAFILTRMGRKYTDNQKQEAMLLRYIWEEVKNSFVSVSDSILKKYPLVNITYFVHRYPIIYKYERLYLDVIFNIEQEIIDFTTKRALTDTESLLRDREHEISDKLSESQQAGITMAIQSSFSLITGEAGTGKTRIIAEIVNILDLFKVGFLLLAPTGAAVNRIRTVVKNGHRHQIMTLDMYYKKGTPKDDNNKPLPVDIIIVDEASMISYPLFLPLIKKLNNNVRLVLIGDYQQLQPINFGCVFEQLINCGVLPVTKLEENFRVQKLNDAIIINAKKILEDESFLEFEEADNFTILDGDLEELSDMIALFAEAEIELKDITVMCPVTKHINAVNEIVWKYYGNGSSVEFQPGKRVMMRVNNYKHDIMNGEEGIVQSVGRDSVVVSFVQNVCVFFKNRRGNDSLCVDDLTVSFCRSIHSAQGSEYPHCIGFFPPTMNYKFQNCKMMYTAITRAQRSFTLIGDLASVRNSCNYAPSEKGEGIVDFYSTF